jgi:hypothetical protein
MKTKELRVRLPADVLKRYRKLCLELDLSAPKQMTQIVINFVVTMEGNKKAMDHLKIKE